MWRGGAGPMEEGRLGYKWKGGGGPVHYRRSRFSLDDSFRCSIFRMKPSIINFFKFIKNFSEKAKRV